MPPRKRPRARTRAAPAPAEIERLLGQLDERSAHQGKQIDGLGKRMDAGFAELKTLVNTTDDDHEKRLKKIEDDRTFAKGGKAVAAAMGAAALSLIGAVVTLYNRLAP